MEINSEIENYNSPQSEIQYHTRNYSTQKEGHNRYNSKTKEDLQLDSNDTYSSNNRLKNQNFYQETYNQAPLYHETGNSNNQNNLYDQIISLKEKNQSLQLKLQDINLIKSELEFTSQSFAELENINIALKNENNHLSLKVESFQNQTKDWEIKVNEITNKLNEMEIEKKIFTEENETLKQKFEDSEFKIKLLKEKEKIHENSLNNLKDIQKNYETLICEVKSDYRNKEELLKRKYEAYEEECNKRIKEIESEYSEKIDNINFHYSELEKQIERLQNENSELTETNQTNSKIFKNKETEYEAKINYKDQQMKELEKTISAVSDEAQSQITKLSENIAEFKQKIDYFNKKEEELTKENLYLQSQLQIANEKCISLEKELTKVQNINETNLNNSYLNKSVLIQEQNNEKLKSKLKEKDRIISDLEREIEFMKDSEITKEENFEKYCSELKMTLYKAENNLQQFEFTIAKKDQEIEKQNKEIQECSLMNSRLRETVEGLKRKLEGAEKEIKSLVERFNNNKIKYERSISDLQCKLEGVILKENEFNSQIIASNLSQNRSFALSSKPTRLNDNRNNITYGYQNEINYSKNVSPNRSMIIKEDDDLIRKKISDQINFIRNRLDKNK